MLGLTLGTGGGWNCCKSEEETAMSRITARKLSLMLAGGVLLGALIPRLTWAAQEAAAGDAPRPLNAEKETQVVS